MEGDLAVELRPNIGDAEHVDEEARELMRLRGQFPCLKLIGLPLKEIGVEDLDHRYARTGRPDNDLGIPERLHRDTGRRTGLVPVA